MKKLEWIPQITKLERKSFKLLNEAYVQRCLKRKFRCSGRAMLDFLSPSQRSDGHYGYPLRKASAGANGLKTSYFTPALTFPSGLPTRKAHLTSAQERSEQCHWANERIHRHDL